MSDPTHVAHGGQTDRLAKPIRIWYQSFTEPRETSDYHDRLVSYCGSAARQGTSIEVRGMSPPARKHRITELRCALDAVRNAIEAERSGFDAFLLGHFQDSGLYEARSAVDIPVIGLGQTSMLHACTLGSQTGLITISPIFIPFHRDQIRRYGLQDRVTEIRAVDSGSGDYVRAFEDPATAQRLEAMYRKEMESLIGAGVEVVLPAGGLPALLFGDSLRTSADPAILIDPIAIAIKACEMAVDLHRFSGLRPSRFMTFAKPTDAALDAIGVTK